MTERLVYRLYQLYWLALDWVFPSQCGGCGAGGTRWCETCQKNIHKMGSMVCPLCGQGQPDGSICRRCQDTKPRYTALRSCVEFDGNVRQALHRLKYRKDTALGEVLARNLIAFCRESTWKIDLVTPVPLGLARLKQRGYNQSALLARPVALALNLRFCPKALQRARETRTQVGLTAAERKQNVTGAFLARSDRVARKNVLVIDDVTTSGATLDACAVALQEAGAGSVYGLTLARAVLKTAANAAAEPVGC